MVLKNTNKFILYAHLAKSFLNVHLKCREIQVVSLRILNFPYIGFITRCDQIS